MLNYVPEESMTEQKHPVSYDKKTDKWITIKGEHNSWTEAMQAVKNKLTE